MKHPSIVAVWATLSMLGCQTASSEDIGDSGETVNPSSPDSSAGSYTDPETGTVYKLNTNRRVVLGAAATTEREQNGDLGSLSDAINANGNDTDWSGRVAIQVVECDSGSYQYGSISLGCSVDSDYVLIGGGAQDIWNNPGAMLWESRPSDTNDSGAGTTWLASSKDHQYAASHKLTTWAVGLRLKKTDGSWMSRTELKTHVFYRTVSSGSNSQPSATCLVPTGRLVVGGGARANAYGWGQLLTASYPSNSTSWLARSKDHITADASATVTSYCIGIDPNITGFGTLIVDRIAAQQYSSTGVGVANQNVGNSPKSVPACWGGQSNFSSWGRMLFRMSPQDNDLRTATAQSKDHGTVDSGYTYSWMTQIRKQ